MDLVTTFLITALTQPKNIFLVQITQLKLKSIFRSYMVSNPQLLPKKLKQKLKNTLFPPLSFPSPLFQFIRPKTLGLTLLPHVLKLHIQSCKMLLYFGFNPSVICSCYLRQLCAITNVESVNRCPIGKEQGQVPVTSGLQICGSQLMYPLFTVYICVKTSYLIYLVDS